MSRAINTLRSFGLGPGDPGPGPAPPDNVLQWVLSVWAEQGRRTELPVQGFSMWPLLRSGDRITVRHGGAPPALGQVVVLLQDRRTIAHRVIAVRKRGGAFEVRTKGDFTLTADPGWVGQGRLVGVIEGIERRGKVLARRGLGGSAGRFIAFLSRTQGFLCAPLGPYLRGPGAPGARAPRG